MCGLTPMSCGGSGFVCCNGSGISVWREPRMPLWVAPFRRGIKDKGHSGPARGPFWGCYHYWFRSTSGSTPWYLPSLNFVSRWGKGRGVETMMSFHMATIPERGHVQRVCLFRQHAAPMCEPSTLEFAAFLPRCTTCCTRQQDGLSQAFLPFVAVFEILLVTSVSLFCVFCGTNMLGSSAFIPHAASTSSYRRLSLRVSAGSQNSVFHSRIPFARANTSRKKCSRSVKAGIDHMAFR